MTKQEDRVAEAVLALFEALSDPPAVTREQIKKFGINMGMMIDAGPLDGVSIMSRVRDRFCGRRGNGHVSK